MITTGSKYFYGVGVLGLVAAFFYAVATSGHAVGMDSIVGPLSLGYKGYVGDHIGYAVLVAIAGAAFFAGGVATAVRDADPEAEAELAGLEQPPAVTVPTGVSYWPILAAFGAGVTILGLVESAPIFVLGLVISGVVTLEWTIRAWSDRATDDVVANRTIRNRLLNPIEIPLMAILGIALFVFAVSRILLAVSELGAALVFGGVPAVVFVVAILLNARPQVGRNLVAGLVVVGAVALLAGGVAGLVHGPREIEHEEPHSHPYVVKGTSAGPVGSPLVVKVLR